MKKLNLLLVLVITLFSLNANASVIDDAKAFFGNLFSTAPTPVQTNVINYETFDGTTFPPAGWTQKSWNYSNSWTRAVALSNPYCLPHSGTGMARINTGTNLSGNPVEYSWLITPSFDLTTGQGIVSFWMYRSMDAPGSPDSLVVQVNTVADTVANPNLQTIGQIKRETQFNGWYQYTFLIPASYNTATNYVLFKAIGYGGANIAIDDVTFGVPSNMTYVSGTVLNNTNPITPNSVNNHILGIPVITTGNSNPFNITKFKLRTTGSTNPSNDIRNARIYYTGKYNTFTTSPTYATQYGNTITNPNGNFEISGAQTLADTNYFWLTYDIIAGAVAGDTVYAVCDSIIGTNLGSVSPTPGTGGRIINTPVPGGTYVIGPGQTAPNYATFTAAFADLSLRGISGPVVFNVKPAVYGTDAGVEIDSSVTLNTVFGASTVNTITFKKKSDEVGEVYLERRGTASGVDNILTLNGVSYATFDSINIRQKDTLTYNQVETGYFVRNATAVIGSSFNIIRNAKIFLKASNINSVGIKDSSAVPVTLLSGINSYNKYQNNTITNCYTGIKLNGFSGGAVPNNTNGRYNEITGNTITGFGGLATATSGIYTNFQMFIKVANNTILSGPGSTNAVYGIQMVGNNYANVDVISNTVTLTSGTSSGIISPIYVQATPGNSASVRSHCNIQNNIVKDLNLPATNTGLFYGIYAVGSNSPDTMNITGNVIKNSTIGTSNSICAMYYVQGASVNLNISNDSVYNVVKNSLSANTYFIYSGAALGYNGIARINNNYIANDSITSGTNVYGIFDNGSANANNYYINNNTINNISSSVSTIFYGIYTNTGNNRSIFSNKVNKIVNYSASNSARIHGLYINAGQFIYAYNNSISNLRMPSGVDSNAVTGIYVTGPAGPSNLGLYYNSIYLADTSSSATYGNSGIYDADTMRVDIRNNNIVNLSKSGGTGRNSAVGLRLAGSAILRNSPLTNGNNNYYSNGLVYYDITNSFSNAQFKNFMGYMNPREQGTVNENSPFVDAYGGNLRINTGLSSFIYKGGLPVNAPVAVTNDYDGNPRSLTYPSIGFSEFSGTPATDVVAPVITYIPFGNGNSANRTLSGIVVSDPSRIDTSANRPRVYYKKTTNANTFNDNTNATDGWKYAAANGTDGSPFNFTINYSLIFGGSVTTGDTVQYFITAQDLAATPNVGINSGMFTTVPSSVNLTAANFPLLGTINKYVITGSYSNNINVGATETITSLTNTGGLFDLINKGVISGNINAVITSNLITESGKVGLKAWSEQMAPTQYSLRIIPDGTTERIISGWYTYGNTTNDTMGLIRFAGASKVTIDGGSGKYLRIRNNARGAAINFFAGATFDTVKNCTIESLGDQTSFVLRNSPVLFTWGTLSQGTSYNVLANNVIRERTDTTDASGNRIPLYMAVWSEGRGINSMNTNNLIYGNEIINFTQGGVFLTSTNTGNGNGWTIRKNSFYFNLPVAFTYQFMAINASLGIFGGLTIDSNYIGGTAANCGGSYLYSQNPSNFYLMNLSTGYDSITTINANTIQNIRSYPGQGSTIKFNGIVTSQGWMDIKGNIFGSADTSKTIVYNGSLQLINASNSSNGVIRPLTISNNIATNIFTRQDSVITTIVGSYQRNLILSSGNAPLEISGNVLTHIYSWQTPGNTSPGASYLMRLDGISVTSQQKVVVKNNIISDFGNKATAPYTASTKNYVYGISNQGGIGDSSLIANNKISGIFTSNTAGGNDIIAAISSLGAYSYGSSSYIVNNQITMTDNQSNLGLVFGIYDPGTNFYTVTTNYFNNTVLLSGTSNSEQPSYAFFKVGGSSIQYANMKNNIFYNSRTSPVANNFAMGVSNYGLEKKTNSKGNGNSPAMGGSSTFNSDYNLLITASTNSICDWYGSPYSFSKWKSMIGYDANSKSDTSANIPAATLFRSVSTGNLNIDTTQYGVAYVYKKGDGINAVNNDYNYYPRATSGPVNYGSHEFALTKPVALNLVSPANNSTGNQVPLLMVWTKGIYAASYRVQISTDSTFASFNVNTSVSDSTFTFANPSPQTKYYWRVNPVYGTGVNGDFTSVYNFRVIGNASQVVLNSPANNAVDQPYNLTFNWFKSVDLTNAITAKITNKSETTSPLTVNKYWFELASDSSFNNIITRDTVLTDSTKSVSGLTPYTKYFWRVKASNQFGWNNFSNVWNFTTILPPVPAAPVLVSPVNGATGIGLLPTISWNAVTYATAYRLQVSTDSTFTTVNYDTASIPGVQVTVPSGKLAFNTKYFWRVNGTNVAGTGSYSVPWNFRTQADPTALTISNFTGVIPKYMASGTSTRLPVAFYGTVGGLVPGKTYRYYNMAAIYSDLGTTNSGAGILMLINKLTQTFTYSSLGSLTTAGQYETFTANGSGSYSGWFAFLNSGNARFTAGNYVMPTIILGDSVGSVIARYALNDSINVLGFSTTAGSPNGTGIYGVSLALPKNFVALYDNTTGTGRPLSQTYVEDEGVTAASVAAFYTDSVNARNGRWGSIIPNTLPNGVQRVEQKSYLDGSIVSYNTSSTGIWPSGTNTVNPAGGLTALRLGLNDAPLLNTNLVTPVNGTIDVAPTLTVTWAAANTATGYRLQVSTDSNFVTASVDTTMLAASLAVPAGKLTTNTKYYWRVNVTNIIGTSAWTSVWNFTTVPNSPNTPVLSTPSNGAVNQPLALTFKWLKAVETLTDVKKGKLSTENGQLTTNNKSINRYWFELSTDSTFSSVVLRDTARTDTTASVSGLSNNVKYFWRVKALNQTGWSSFSSPWYFTTIPAIPATPTLVSPVNNAIDLSLTPALLWNAVSTAASYRVQVSTSNTFGTTLLDSAGITGVSIIIPAGKLTTNTKYYWRVSATNAAGTGSYSAVWNFTTYPNAPNVPVLSFPANNSTGVSTSFAFTWFKAVETLVSGKKSNNGQRKTDNDSPDAISKYWIQYGTDSTFTTVLVSDSTLTDTTKTVTGLNTGTKYFWRVKAKNQTGWGNFSSVWNFTTLVPSLSLNLKVYLEGFWDGTTQISDTVTVYLANPTTPYAFADTAKVVLSTTGTASMNFNRVTTGNYYIVVSHRNHLETWSKYPQSFVGGTPLSYDFTTAMTQAYGDNMKQVGSVWVLFGGDANADGSIDANDIGIFITEFGNLGYLRSDFNGDQDVNASDVLIISNNFGLIKITPGVEPYSPETIKGMKTQLENAIKNKTLKELTGKNNSVNKSNSTEKKTNK